MNKQFGFTLTEVLLVILVAAVIVLISVRRYFIYRHELYISQVRNDVATIFSAMREYYQAEGCKSDGIFNGSVDSDLIDGGQLQLAWDRRLPLITHYQAFILDTDKQTSDKKEIYQFQVKATLSDDYSPSDYQGILNAGSSDEQILIWQNLPNQNVEDTVSSLWILNAERNVFKQAVAEEGDSTCAF